MSEYCEGGIAYNANGPEDDCIPFTPTTDYVIPAAVVDRFGDMFMEQLRNEFTEQLRDRSK